MADDGTDVPENSDLPEDASEETLDASFEYAEQEREEWMQAAGVALAAGFTALRTKMANGVGTAPKIPAANEVFDPEWFDLAMEEYVYGEFADIGTQAATQFATAHGLDLSAAVLTGIGAAAAATTVELISSRSSVIEERVTELVERGNADGWDSARLASELGLAAPDEIAGGPASDAMGTAIATGAATSLVGQATQAVIEEADLRGTKTWNCAFHNSREDHIDANGQTVAVNEQFEVGDEWAWFPGDPELSAGQLVNCLAAGSTVTLPGLRYAMRRWYEGQLVHLRFASGDQLSVTPNHPVLGASGEWKRAQDFEVGDHVLSGRLVGGLSGEPDVERRPAEVSELHRALTLSGVPKRVAGGPPDFHGDGRHGDVEVVSADGLLGHQGHAASDEQVDQFGLAAADLARAAEGGCSGGYVTVRSNLGGRFDEIVAAGPVGGSGERPTLSRRHLGGAVDLSIAPVSGLDPGPDETPADRVPGDSEAAGDGQLALTLGVSTDEVVDIEVDSEWTGWVYNFDTGHGWYLTGSGVICRNCNCWLTYTVAGVEADTGEGEDAGDVPDEIVDAEPEVADAGAVVASPIKSSPTLEALARRASFGGPGSGPRFGDAHPHAGHGKGSSSAPLRPSEPITAPSYNTWRTVFGSTPEIADETHRGSRIAPVAEGTTKKPGQATDLEMRRFSEKTQQKIRDQWTNITGQPAGQPDPDHPGQLLPNMADQNLRDLFAEAMKSEDAVVFGTTWYSDAHDHALALGEQFGVNVECGAGIIAALSPGGEWQHFDPDGKETGNKIQAVQILEFIGQKHYDAHGKEITDPLELARLAGHHYHWSVGTSYANHAKAIEIALDGKPDATDRILNGPKVRSFYNNILFPKDDTGDVTIDQHMLNIAFGGARDGREALIIDIGKPKLDDEQLAALGVPKDFIPNGWKAVVPADADYHVFQGAVTKLAGSPTDQGRKLGVLPMLSDTIRNIARENKMLPQEVQAIMWVYWRDKHQGEKREASKAVIGLTVEHYADEWKANHA